jgi:hypothetical protein
VALECIDPSQNASDISTFVIMQQCEICLLDNEHASNS